MTEVAEINLSLISSDIALIGNKIGANLIGLALFGSCLTRSITEANDIDLAVFVEGKTLGEVRDLLVNSDVHFPIKARTVNGSYASSIPDFIGEQHYHIMVLDFEHLNKKFIEYNRGKLHFVNSANDALHMDKFSALLQICQ